MIYLQTIQLKLITTQILNYLLLKLIHLNGGDIVNLVNACIIYLRA